MVAPQPLGAHPAQGLSSAEAANRLRQYGPNEVRSSNTTAWHVLIRQLKSPLLLLLAVTASASDLVGQRSDAIIIGALLPLSPLAPTFGFVPLSPTYFAALLGMVVVYGLIVDRAKHSATAKLVLPA